MPRKHARVLAGLGEELLGRRQRARNLAVYGDKQAAGFDIAPSDFLNALGLHGAQYRVKPGSADSALSYAELGDGIWDERSGGAVAVKTRAGLDRRGRLRHLEVNYLCLQPNGHYTVHKLCELSTRLIGARLRLGMLSVLDIPIETAKDDQVARVMGALQRMHADIRNLRFPEVAKIFNDFQIAGILGERLDLLGLSPKGGFTFTLPLEQPQGLPTPFVLPKDFSQELMGCGANDLDSTYAFGRERHQIGANPRGGELFRYSAKLATTRKAGIFTSDVAPLSPQSSVTGASLIDLGWKVANDDPSHIVVDRFVLRGDESHQLSPFQRQRRLGVVNMANKDLRTGRYPGLPDYFARYQQHDLTDERSFGLELDGRPQMVVIPFCGHNDREYLPGFGDTIGGNSKGVFACWRDDGGRVHRKGVLIDFGIIFNKKNGIRAGEHGHFDYVLPDISGFHGDFDDILITHLHADHMQGVIDLALCNMAATKTVHAAVYDCRVLTQSLKKAKVPEAQWPKMNPLHGEGWIHVKDQGHRVLSVFYSTNAIPHSTNVTAFAVANAPYLCKEDGSAVEKTPAPNPHYWSYASLGDMSFGRYNLPDYVGEKPPDTGLKRDFFANFRAGMRREFAHLPEAMDATINRIGVVEIDPTSIHRDGFAPDVVAAQKNWVQMHSWFVDKGMIIPNLSTAKRGHEMMFRVAAETGRHVSSEGAYIQDRFRDMNIEGVNIDVLSKHPDGGNIQKYIDWYAGSKGLEPVRHLGRTAQEWRDIMAETPHRTIILATGSQGSEIEKDSVGTQAAEGWSRFHLDHKYCRAAYGVDPKNFIFVYAQGAIPGHEDEQLAQIRKTAFENDQMVAVAVHNGTRFFNLKEPYISRIVSDLEKTGHRYTREDNGGLHIHGFSLYVPGHGWKEDYRQGFMPWFKDNQVQSIWVQHFSRHESVRISYGLADEAGLGHPPEPTSNHSVCTLKNGTHFHIAARLTPSFILARTNRRSDKYHGGTSEYKRAVFRAGENGMSDNGLFAANENSVFFQDFGWTDQEQQKREATPSPARSRRSFDKAMTRRAQAVYVREHLPTRGALNPLRRPIPAHIVKAGLR